VRTFFVSDLFFLHAAGAVIAFRAAAALVPNWARQFVLALISVYFLTWLTGFGTVGPFLAVYMMLALSIGCIMLRQGQQARPLVVAGACSACIGVLVLFKYNMLLPEIKIAELQEAMLQLRAIEWVGLSYLTFKTIDFLVNFRIDNVPAGAGKTGWLYACSYLLFFPAYVSGPINRFRSYLDEQSKSYNSLTFERVRANVFRMSLGVVKVLLLGKLAKSYSLLGDEFPGLDVVSFPALALSLYAFLLYYYFDFSGYCDVAIALADFFEVRLPENFNYPFAASNPQDFWNRWNATLTQWLRDFVFFRVLRFLTVRCPRIPEFPVLVFSSFFTLALMGAWHGHTLNWLLYGCYHGLAFCLHLSFQYLMEGCCPEFYDDLRERRWYRGICIFLTFNYVAWGLLLTLPLARLEPLLSRFFG
jgi:D-alanyl-lipoteichoic acid acyltransferase DltB (MBOAT superfamily)